LASRRFTNNRAGVGSTRRRSVTTNISRSQRRPSICRATSRPAVTSLRTARSRQDRDAGAAQNGFLNRLVAAEFKRDPEVGEGSTDSRQSRLERVPQPRSRFPRDKRLSGEPAHGHGLLSGQGVALRDHENHPVGGEVANIQMAGVGLSAHQPNTHFAPLQLVDYARAVADGCPHADIRMQRTESREKGWQEAVAGNRTGGEGKFACNRSLAAGHFLVRFAVEVKDAAGILVQSATGVGQFDLSAGAAEQRHAEFAFECLDALADGSLRESEGAGGGGETRPPRRTCRDVVAVRCSWVWQFPVGRGIIPRSQPVRDQGFGFGVIVVVQSEVSR
jgi:hypothetical protein